MTLGELRYIVALARERHFGRAARACHVSQPTLSVAVRKLEAELGVALFERRRGEVGVTPVGTRVVAQAQRALEVVDGIRQIARREVDQLHAPLRLGAIYTVGPYLLPKLIPALHARAPDMPLVIEEGYTDGLHARLKQGELDAVLVSLPFADAGLVTLPLYREPFVALLPGSHPLAGRESMALEELARERLLLLGPGHCFRDQVLEACPECGRSVSGAGEDAAPLAGGSLETIRHMVASGMGVTVLPCSAAGSGGYDRHLLAVRPLQAPVPRRKVALAWRASYPRPKAIEALRRAIRECPMSCVEFLY